MRESGSPCIHELLERKAKEQPNSVAVVCGTHRITHAELNARANAVARRLIEQGAGPEVFVGIAMERSIEAIIGLAGILKAGAAYVYLDPTYPARRLRDIVEDCRPLTVLEQIPDESCAKVERTEVTSTNAAYLLYTSGSTGRPRGIIEIHRSLTARLACLPLPDIQHGDVCSLNSSFSFGISTSRLFLPLAIGAPVVVIPDQCVRDVGRFTETLAEYGVTSVFMVPALLREVLRLGGTKTASLRSIRAVTVSGGTLTRDLAGSFFEAFPQALLMNNYGSGEIGTSAASKVYTKATGPARITIGRPAANTTISILDENLKPVPPGESGEICVEAPHLARGYLNLPELTRARFVTCGNGQRIYRTGDRGRYQKDGEVEFLGRTDQQVKVRGFRIELGEIEAALESHEDVRQSAVAATNISDIANDKRLVAYISLRSGALADATAFREFLSRRVPEYMIPSQFVFLPQLPHTDAGKLDRSAMAALEPKTPEYPDKVGLASPIEEILADIWKDTLGLQEVGRDDNFIELGGDSLQATQVISRIETLFCFRIRLDTLFDLKLGEIAAEITNAQ